MACLILEFLLQDCSSEERQQHYEYINGDQTQDGWIEKALVRREYLLSLQLRCYRADCNEHICIYENGKVSCNRRHNNYRIVSELLPADLS